MIMTGAMNPVLSPNVKCIIIQFLEVHASSVPRMFESLILTWQGSL